jgi:hypothetical protein
MTVTDTLAYYDTELITAVISLMVHTRNHILLVNINLAPFAE